MNQLYIIIGILAVVVLALAAAVIDIRQKMKKLFGGETLGEDVQKDVIRRIARFEAKLEEIEPRLGVVEAISKISVQKVGFARFNPFKDTGGDQSFIAVFLDRSNNGMVISSLYMRDGMRVYGKNIERGTSKYPLSEEEQKVVEETIVKN